MLRVKELMPPPADYLHHYLSAGLREDGLRHCCSMLCEEAYHSSNYLAEHQAYYSKCHADLTNKARRVHFFKKVNPDELERLYDAALLQDVDAVATLGDHYLGHVVVRPLPGARVGYTLLVPYSEAPGHREFLTHKYTVWIGGIPLTIRATPFMQQDQAVAACASTAIWVAFRVLPRSLVGIPPSTVEITRRATEHRIMYRPTPASSGLDVLQISDAMRLGDWAPDIVQPQSVGEFGAVVRAAIESRVPIVLSAHRVEPSADLDVDHAMAIVGYSKDSVTDWSWQVDRPNGSGKLAISMPSARKVYIHDDQRGPYYQAVLEDVEIDARHADALGISRIEPDGNAPEDTDDLSDEKGQINPILIPGFEAENQRGEVEKWAILYAHVPSHVTVNLSIENICKQSAAIAMQLDSDLFADDEERPESIDVEFRFENSHIFARSIGALCDVLPEIDIREFLRECVMPPIVGVTKIHLGDFPLCTLGWDATDFCRIDGNQFSHLVAVIAFQESVREMFQQYCGDHHGYRVTHIL